MAQDILFLITGSVGAQVPTPVYFENDGTGNVPFSQPSIAGVPVSPTAPMPVGTNPGLRTQIALDVGTITNAGTAVVAIATGHRTAGALLQTGNAAGFYVNEIGTAGTTVGNGTMFVFQYQVWQPSPSTGAVSVNATVSGVVLSGWGLQ
jgi:hypothetical protein